ncbi:PIG-L family deacetylase [Streptomyces sp. NPDC060028]|uniref:PIG-L family deacetylase n=1 Tax=Streptomyces sp. NPDC060028 TaxID=3347041 RepID=UPI0036B3A66A
MRHRQQEYEVVRGSERGERVATRGRRKAVAENRPSPDERTHGQTPPAGRVLHVLAHPGDALGATAAELFRALREPGRPVVVVCLARSGQTDRDRLLQVIGRGGTWRRTAESLPDGEVLDVFALSDAPHVEVCFADPAEPPAGGAPAELVDRVVDLLELFEPGTVCTLDPDPDHTGWSAATGATRPDHPEHTAVAEAVLVAVHRAAAGGLPVAVECFRSPAPCEAPSGPAPAVVRYPGRPVALTRAADGQLTAYAVLGGRLARWTERSAGAAEWGERELLDSPELLPVLAVAQTRHGWVHLVSLRRTPRPGGGAIVEVMHAVQYQSGRPLGEWRSLGNPNGNNHDKGREVGVPAVIVDAEGCLHVYARNFGRGVSCRTQRADGSWTSWQDIKGSEVQDGLAAVLDDAGAPELYAPSGGGVLRWRRNEEGAMREVADDRLPLFVAPGTAISALLTGPGRVTVYGCDVRDRMLYAYRTDRASTPIGTAGGEGVGALRMAIDGYDCTVLLQRSAEGAVAVGAYPTEQENAGLWWERTGGSGIREPAAAVDALGRLVIASLDGDGRLAVVRQDVSVSGLMLGGWVTV